jgi:hypothetical protein
MDDPEPGVELILRDEMGLIAMTEPELLAALRPRYVVAQVPERSDYDRGYDDGMEAALDEPDDDDS